MATTNSDWLNAPVVVDPQPHNQGPQIPWETVWRFAPWVLLGAVVLYMIARNNTPNSEPTGVTGLRVLVIEESANRSDLDADQLAIFNSVQIREEIQRADGEILFLDADDNTDDLAPEWQRLRKRISSRPPVVVFANPKRAKEMPLPADVREFLEALEGFTK